MSDNFAKALLRAFTLAIGLSATGGHPVALAQQTALPPNRMGRIPILEYHLITDKESRWGRDWHRFAQDLETLYARGYRPITVSQLLDKRFDIPAGTSPVIFTFDDASPGQFRYSVGNGQLEIDSPRVIGIWLAFHSCAIPTGAIAPPSACWRPPGWPRLLRQVQRQRRTKIRLAL